MELLHRYSNRLDLVEPLVDVVRRIHENDQSEEPGLSEDHRVGNGPYKIAERLSENDMQEIAELYRSGTTARELAEKFSIGRSSIKRILLKYGARRRDL